MNGFQHKQLYFLSKLNESLSQWRSTNKPETNNHNRYIFVNFEIIQNIRLHKHTIDIQLDCVHVNAKLTTYHSQKIYNIYPIAGDERKIKRGKNYNNFDLLFVNNNLQCVSWFEWNSMLTDFVYERPSLWSRWMSNTNVLLQQRKCANAKHIHYSSHKFTFEIFVSFLLLLVCFWSMYCVVYALPVAHISRKSHRPQRNISWAERCVCVCSTQLMHRFLLSVVARKL